MLAGADAATLEYANAQVTAAEDALAITGLASPDPRTTVDCLSLDVIAPESIFNQNTSAPVLVWIFGGEYVNGTWLLKALPFTIQTIVYLLDLFRSLQMHYVLLDQVKLT